MEAVSFARVCVRMITRVQAQVVEDLCILHDGASSLCGRTNLNYTGSSM
jgi:hypothetical protein